MADACPVADPADPLVQSLLASTDCHVQALVQVGYAGLFAPGGTFAGVLTAALTVYVALIGYRLMLGHGGLSVSDFALSAVKIGAVLALATQWPLYEGLVYATLFRGPEQLADAVLRAGGGPHAGGDLLVSLQHAVDTLNTFSPDAPPGPLHRDPRAAAAMPSSLPQHMSPAGFDAFLWEASSVVLLLGSLGVLVTAKIVLSLLLALGPVFIGLFLFDSTRGLFTGWLRASLASALLPLFATASLGLALTLLSPSLILIQQMNDTDTYLPGVGVRVVAVVLVSVLAVAGLSVAAGVIAFAIRLPTRPTAPRPATGLNGRSTMAATPAAPDRADRIVSALAAQDRTRITMVEDRAPAASSPAGLAAQGGSAPVSRLGDARRRVRPSDRRRPV